MAQVRAEYDFEAQPGSGEISIRSGEILTVIRENIDGGWMEGRNIRGSVGLFPETYVSPYQSNRAPPPTVPPPLPQVAPSAAATSFASPPPPPPPARHNQFTDDWGGASSDVMPPAYAPSHQHPSATSLPEVPRAAATASNVYPSAGGDDFDDEWTDEDEEQEHRLSVHDPSAVASSNQHHHHHRASGSRTDMSTDEERSSQQECNKRNGSVGSSNSTKKRLSRQDSTRRRRPSEERDSRRRIEKSATSGSVHSGRHHHSSSIHSGHHDSLNNKEPSRPTITSSSLGSNSRRDLSRSHSEHGDRGSNKVNKNINRFSNFVKSGVEAYVIGESKTSAAITERHEVVLNQGIVMWKPIQQYYTCRVDKPKKESKLKGLKSFIAYSITSSLTHIQVSRRYKHFDWLHEQLSAKYIFIPIPPLPEKQVAGRYEEDLIDHRMHILQLWVNKICRHPVLSQSEVWLHFISCTDEKEWKNGKRRAEKDEYIGGSFLNCITVPQQPLDPNSVDQQVERFQRSVKTSEEAMRVMQERMSMFQKVFAGPVKQNWQKMGSAFKTLQQSFEIDETVASRRLTDALAYTASEYHEIGQVFEQHTKNDMEPVLENLYSYKGTVQNVPDIIHVHKQALQKFRESEGRLSAAEADKMKQRIDAMSYAVIAEIQHQTAEKVEDLKHTMGTYLKKQASFYQDVASKLTTLSTRFE